MIADSIPRNSEAGLDGLRGLAALMVFVYHLRWNSHEPVLLMGGIDWQPSSSDSIPVSVCFFILSGFLLSKPF